MTSTDTLHDLRTVLVANRGEIARRVIRTLRRLGIRSVAVYSDADADAPHVREADVAVRIGASPAAESYLRVDAVIEAATATGADAIHPGYGFLSESAALAEACRAASIVFIGPDIAALEIMGDKAKARDHVVQHGVPVVPGFSADGLSDDEIRERADQVGYPLLVKPSAGGGGKGMEVVHDSAGLAPALATARRVATAAFGDDAMVIERLISRPRHIEVQVFGDQHGTVQALGERECTLQRRHQKVIEEAPAADLPEHIRTRLLDVAVKAAESVSYVGAGTVEFLVDADAVDEAYFIEMNTRLQVEHPVTEAITGLDLVAWQIRVARGEPLPISQAQMPLNGHAIEVRLYAEDPDHDFLPATGTLALYREAASGDGRRIDSGVAEGDSVSPFYDPMLGKLIAWGENREQARLRLLAMLGDTLVGGVKTNLAFLCRILAHPAFAACELDTGFISRHQQQLLPAPSELPEAFWQLAADAWVQSEAPLERDDDPHSPWATRSGWRAGGVTEIELHLSSQGESRKVRANNRACLQGEELLAEIDGTRQRLRAIRRGETLYLQWRGELHAITRFDPIAAVEASHAQHGGLSAPMNGSIVRVLVEPGQTVEAGAALVVLEAMKMEHSIRAPQAGTVKALYCREGEMVSEGAVLVELEP